MSWVYMRQSLIYRQWETWNIANNNIVFISFESANCMGPWGIQQYTVQLLFFLFFNSPLGLLAIVAPSAVEVARVGYS